MIQHICIKIFTYIIQFSLGLCNVTVHRMGKITSYIYFIINILILITIRLTEKYTLI